jgi:GT2 family glycosyltransferase
MVSVIVPARDAEATLARTLDCLGAQDTDLEFEVVVVDDGSTDGTAALAASAGGHVRLVSQAREGAAQARNLGVAESSGDALAFLDADCFPAPGWLAAGVAALEHAELVQGRVLPDPAAELGPFDRTLWVPRQSPLWETANLFVTRKLFDRTGGFEDWLTSVAGKLMAEDLWFGWRAVRLGARTAFCAEALAHHAVFPRTAAGYVRERLRRRHFPQIVARVPELREAFLVGGVFLNARTAALDGALAGLAAAAASRRGWPLAAALPYAWLVAQRARRYPPAYGAKVAAADVAADLVGAWALLRGSAEARTPVL